MTFFKRLGFYGFGFILGIILLMFFLNEKNAGCDYLPNARILKLIREKPLNYSDAAINSMQNLNINSIAIKKILIDGDIDFSKSKTHIKPCRYYLINGSIKKKEVSLYFESCDSIATLKSIKLLK